LEAIVRLFAALVAVALALGVAVHAQDRLPPILPDKYTAEQKKKVDEYKALRKENGPGGGPYVVLLRSPEAYLATAALSEYLRFHSPIGLKLTEFASLISAYHMKARFQYGARYNGSQRQGVKPEVLEAISQGRRPENMPEDEAFVYDFCTELHVNKYVSDATYAKALKKFGEQGVVDITAISGYYAYIAMITNMARTPSGNTANLPPTFPRWAVESK
jgi:4-carboxymuconolactone decarboxylase